MTESATSHKLTPAQVRYFDALIADLAQAEHALSEAQRTHSKAQAVATSFINYCAEELQVVPGLVFDQASLSFVAKQSKEGN